MRPLTLTIAGLRSYRQRTEIDFGDVTLMAIVGDTGAGKTSLLEAITYALYGSSTWSGQPGDLIADNTRTMMVELVFHVDGQRWKATRSMSREGSPPSVHRLVCLDQPGHRIDGRSNVNAAVERLIGLDLGAFLRSVLLPQGRFAELLQATDAERTAILRNIFRVDELERARLGAEQLLTRLRPEFKGLQARRSMLLGDPMAAAAEAGGRLERWQKRKDELDKLQDRLAELAQQIMDKDESATAARQLATELGDPRFTGIAARLQALGVRAVELSREREVLDAERREIEVELREHDARLREAEQSGAGLAALNRAERTLQTLMDELPGLADDVTGLHRTRIEVEAETERLRLEAEKAARLTDQRKVADTEARRCREHAAQTQKAVEHARVLLRTARDQHTAVQQAAKAVTDHERSLPALELSNEQAKLSATSAKAALDTARTDLARARRAEAAAHAAHGLGPGDPCPVCVRELPAEFVPPVSSTLTAAEQEADQAEQRAFQEREGVTKAQAKLDEAKRRLVELCHQRQQQQTRLDDRLREASLALRGAQDSLAAGELHHADDDLLGSLLAAADEARRKSDEADRHAATLGDQASRAIQRVESERRGLEIRQKDWEGTRRRLQQRLTAVARQAEALPNTYRPTLPDPNQLLGGTVDPISTLDASKLAPLRQASSERLAELSALRETRDDLAGRLQRLSEAREQLDGRYRQEVDDPVGEARLLLGGLAERAAWAAQHLGAPAPPPTPGTEDMERLVMWASELEFTASDLAALARNRAAAAAEQVRAARDEASQSLAAAELPEIGALDAARIDAAGKAGQAQRDLEMAQQQVPIAADLDRRLEAGGTFLGAVGAVKELLTDGQFIGHVVRRRQQALLGVASQILGEITAQRFGFAADFRVVDRITAQPRSPKTLSGGEGFLASLALALGMVELAGRAGGRLDALFLDEGFGALDTASLDGALDALEARAAKGRLVAVISHVRAVAERIEDVLAVHATPAGSQVRWLSRADRAEAINEDLAASVASGLLG